MGTAPQADFLPLIMQKNMLNVPYFKIPCTDVTTHIKQVDLCI